MFMAIYIPKGKKKPLGNVSINFRIMLNFVEGKTHGIQMYL
jgi:hypothetical protein